LGDGWNEIVMDGRGNIYIDCVGFSFARRNFDQESSR